MRSFNGTASAIVLSSLAALALSGCVGEVSDPSSGAGAVGEAQAADQTTTTGPGVPWGTASQGPTTQGSVPANGSETAPSSCSCGQAAASNEQGSAAPEQGSAPPTQGSATPTQGPPAQGAVGGVPIGGCGGVVGAPIVAGGCCCCGPSSFLDFWFGGWPLCMRI